MCGASPSRAHYTSPYAPRAVLEVGDPVQVFSLSTKQWVDGEIKGFYERDRVLIEIGRSWKS